MSEPTLPSDDDPVVDGTDIYRLVPIEQCTVEDGEWCPRSGAFDNSSLPGFENEMSVVVGDTLELLDRHAADLPAQAYPDDPDRWGVAVLKAECIRAVAEQTIRRSRTGEERAHGDVLGKKGSGRRKKLKACAEWVVPPAARPL